MYRKSTKLAACTCACLALLFTLIISCCTPKEKEIVYTEFPKVGGPDLLPSLWQSYNMHFWLNGNWQDKTNMTGTYQLWLGNGSSFAKGVAHYGDKEGMKFGYLVLDPPDPDSIDFSACDGPDEQKQEMLDYMFPQNKNQERTRCVIEYKADYLDYDYKGAFVYKDSAFYDSSFTEILEAGSDTKIDGYDAVLLKKETYTPVASTYLYSEPNTKSQKLSVPAINWDGISGSKKVTRLETGKENQTLYHGVNFTICGRTQKKYKVGNVSDWWYYARVARQYGWIFGGDIEVYDESKEDEYFASLIESGVNDGLISVEDFDFSSFAAEVQELSIGEEGESYLYVSDSALYYSFPYLKIFAKYDTSCLATDSDGFVKFTYGPGSDDKLLFIFGDQINQYFSDFAHDGNLRYEDEEEEYTPGKYHDYYIKTITASSSLSETLGGRNITYSPKNLGRCFEVGCTCHPYWWNYKHIPWVEGAEGNGIGESVTVEFTQEMNGMSVLNGYVTLDKLKLYKENSRLKQVLIEDLVNGDSWNVNFDDYVYFNYIAFPKATTKVRMTIKSVYAGTKYADTCVSAIIPCKASPYMSEEDQKEYDDYVYENFKYNIKTGTELTPEQLLERIK